MIDLRRCRDRIRHLIGGERKVAAACNARGYAARVGAVVDENPPPLGGLLQNRPERPLGRSEARPQPVIPTGPGTVMIVP
jgi:hypothetical protein